MRFCSERLYCDISCYFGTPIGPDQAAETVRRLKAIDKDNVANDAGAHGIDDRPAKRQDRNAPPMPDMRAWPLMLKSDDGRALEAEISSFLRKEGASLDSSFLVRFMQDFMQVLYSALKSKSLPAHDVFSDDRSAELSAAAVRSVAGMQAWARRAIGRTVEALRRQAAGETPVGLAKDYIARNLTKNLNRDDIAARIGLNPDYLSRVFKKETGLSPVEWIVAERLEYARSLLLKTDLSVGDIAVQVGYSNFSHFSAIFKKRFGLNPRDFKRTVVD